MAFVLPLGLLAVVLLAERSDTPLVLACVGLFTISWDRLSIRTVGLTLKPTYVAFGLALLLDLFEHTGVLSRPISVRAAFTRRTVVAFLVLLLAASAASGFVIEGVRQLVAIIFGALIPAWVCFRLGRSSERRGALISWAVIGAGVTAFVGIYQFVSTYLHLPAFLAYTARAGALGRTAGFSYEPAFFAMYLLSVLPLVVVILLQPEHKSRPVRCFPRTMFCLLLVGVLVANARAAYLLLPLSLLLPLLGGKRYKRILIRPVGLILGAAMFVLLSSVVVHFDLADYARKRLSSITDTQEVASNAARLRLYAADRRIAADHLVLGIGPGTLGYQLPEYGLPLVDYFQGLPLTDPARVVANNIWLQALLDCGIGGVLGVITVIGILLQLALRCRDTYGQGLAVGCLLVFLVGGALTSLFWDAEYWALIGLALAADMAAVRSEGIGIYVKPGGS